jgi:hypothetical protein
MLPGAHAACGHIPYYQIVKSPLPETLAPGEINVILEAPRWSAWMPRPVPIQGGRRVGQTSGEILPTHVYRNEEVRWCGLLLGLVLFRLAAPPLQSGVVAISGAWCMLLESVAIGGNRSYP